MTNLFVRFALAQKTTQPAELQVLETREPFQGLLLALCAEHLLQVFQSSSVFA